MPPSLARRAFLVAPLLPLPAAAQPATPGWPSRPLRFVIPFGPGGSMDLIARGVQARLPEVLGTSLVIENRAGGATIIGTDAVAKLPADGDTALIVANSFTINATLVRNPPFDARRDFTGVASLAFNPHVLIADPRLGLRTVADVVAAARARPGRLTYASSGIGTSLHLGGVSFAAATGTELTHVPYRSSPAAITDVIGGQVALMFANLPDAIPAAREGRVTAIALADAARHPQLPEVPTFEEAGVRGVVSNSWFGLVARSEVPEPILDRLHEAVTRIVNEPENVARLAAAGLAPRPMTRAAFNAFLAAEFERNSRLIRENNITAE